MCSNVCTAGRVCIRKCAFLHLGTDNAIGESPGGQWLLPSGATSMRSCAAFHHSSCGIGAKITPKSLSSRRPGELASDIGDDLGAPGCRPRCPRLLSIRCACSALEPLTDTHMQETSRALDQWTACCGRRRRNQPRAREYCPQTLSWTQRRRPS